MTAAAIPSPSTNCHVCALAPIHPGNCNNTKAAALPNSNGIPNANPAVIELSRTFVLAAPRSSSMPAMNTNNITAHHATPLSAVITCGVNIVV